MPVTATFARRSAFAGFLAWFALGTAVHLRWTTLGMGYGFMLNIAGILIFGVLVTTPLALAAVEPRAGEDKARAPWRLAVLLQPLGAAGVFASFIFKPGPLAALCILPWLAVTSLMALTALARFLPRRFARAEEIFIDAGLAFIPVGAAWLAASRAGMKPMSFEEPIVILTAVHFHFAGLAAPVLAGLTGRRLAAWGRPAWPLFLASGAAITAGVPLLAAGITFSPPLEVAAAFLLAGGLSLLALLTLFLVVPRLPGLTPRLLLTLSSASVAAAMVFAVRYAWGHYGGTPHMTIPRMVTVHGLLNALGFAGCGLLGWISVSRREVV